MKIPLICSLKKERVKLLTLIVSKRSKIIKEKNKICKCCNYMVNNKSFCIPGSLALEVWLKEEQLLYPTKFKNRESKCKTQIPFEIFASYSV